MLRWRPIVLVVSACLVVAACGNSPSEKSKLATNPDLPTAEAVARALNTRAPGEARAAGFVVSSYAAWVAADKEQATAQPGVASPGDKIIVVKLYGDFVPMHSRSIGAAYKHVTTAVTVYDATIQSVIMNDFFDGDAPDITSAQGAVAIPDGRTIRDLRVFGEVAPIDLSALRRK